jgi:glycosyltransferase involved in cell wall biosynthesis
MTNLNKNPLISFCLFTYNQEKYIQKAIEGALNQTYSPIEIIISDDCSTDSTFDIITQIIEGYKGTKKIIVNRNDTNMGIGEHVSKILYNVAQGDYIILLAGDDISKKEHAEESVKYINKYPGINMIDFNGEIIDENDIVIRNIPLPFDEKFYCIDDFLSLKTILSFAPGRIIKRSFLLSFNPIENNCPTEDSVLVIRSYLNGGFLRVNKSLVFYRKHDSNTSNLKSLKMISHHLITTQYLKDILHAYDTNLITNDIYEQLIERICLELKLRTLYYQSDHKKKIFLSLFVRIVKLEYLLKRKLIRIVFKYFSMKENSQ